MLSSSSSSIPPCLRDWGRDSHPGFQAYVKVPTLSPNALNKSPLRSVFLCPGVSALLLLLLLLLPSHLYHYYSRCDIRKVGLLPASCPRDSEHEAASTGGVLQNMGSSPPRVPRPSGVVPFWVIYYHPLPTKITYPKRNYIGAVG